jgi:hypothetical protein
VRGYDPATHGRLLEGVKYEPVVAQTLKGILAGVDAEKLEKMRQRAF